MKTKLFITGLALIAITAMTSAQQNNASQQKPATQPGREYTLMPIIMASVIIMKHLAISTRADEEVLLLQHPEEEVWLPVGAGNEAGSGTWHGSRTRTRSGSGGRFYVDENKNGICDLRENLQK